MAASKTLDFIVEGIEEYTGVTIISKQNDEIKIMLTQVLGHGFTIYKGESGFGKNGEALDIKIIYTVVTRLELNRLKNEINKIDEDAFIIMSSIRDNKGGMVKKRALNH